MKKASLLQMVCSNKLKRIIKNKKFNSKRAISPIIATLLIMGLITTGVVIGLIQIIPFIERSRIESGLTSVQTGLMNIDTTVQKLIANGEGSVSVTMDMPLGRITLLNDRDYFHFNLIGTTSSFNPITTVLGKIYYSTPSSYEIIPVNSYKYLNGPEQTSKRNDVVFINQNEVTSASYNGMSIINMTKTSTDMEIRLFYRPKIVVSQVGPNINIQIQQIKLVWSNDSSSTDYLALIAGQQQIGIKYAVNSVNQYSFNSSVLANQNIELDYQNTGTLSSLGSTWQPIWSSNPIGATGTVLFKLITYQVELVSYV